jgi:protein-disulfide isomerase
MANNNEVVAVKKSSLWLVIVLIVIVVIVAVILLVTKPNNDLEVFNENPQLYPFIGSQNSSDVVIEFSDFQCPFCALASGLPQFAEDYRNQYPDLVRMSEKIREKAENGELKFIYVPMSFLGQESVYASEAALCANKQGKFWEMHDAIFSAHDGDENNGKYSKANLKEMARNISGMNLQEFNNCLDNDETFSDVRQVADEAGNVVSATPSFFVNGEKVSASWTAVNNALEKN